LVIKQPFGKLAVVRDTSVLMPIKKTTRNQIIKQSVAIFRKKGYYKTSMKDLAQACGLLKGSFYYYFKSKEDLMQAVLESMHGYYKEKVFAIAYDDNLSPKERFLKLFEKQAPILTQDLSGCLFGNITLETISNNSEFKEALQAFFDDWQAAFQYIFEAAEHEEATAIDLAKQAIIEIEGAIMMMRLYEDKAIFEEACLRVLHRL